MLDLLKSYFWPSPPERISAESQAALIADFEARGLWSGELDDKHRLGVNVWTLHADNLARSENRSWFHEHGVKFVRRWAVVSCIAWALAWATSGALWFEVPFALVGIAAGALAVFFQFLRQIK